MKCRCLANILSFGEQILTQYVHRASRTFRSDPTNHQLRKVVVRGFIYSGIALSIITAAKAGGTSLEN
jgi:uncharacterized membrane protein